MNHVRALQRLLDQLAGVLVGLTPSLYAAPPRGPSGSIGQHVRHVLDHVTALNAAELDGGICYDHRERGTAIETDLDTALSELLRARTGVARWIGIPLDTPVLVTSVLDGSRQPVADWSTVGRELCFVVNHTVHHHAIIALLLADADLKTPHRFGYAPSTPAA